MTTKTAFNQTADFATCAVAHFATSHGVVECGGRLNGLICEYDHDQRNSLTQIMEDAGMLDTEADCE